MTPHNVEIPIDRQMRRWGLQQAPEGPRVQPPFAAASPPPPHSDCRLYAAPKLAT